MASALTLAHRRQLLAVRAATIRDLAELWPMFDPNDMRTWSPFLKATTLLVQTRNTAAATLGVRYYDRLRAQRRGLPANDVDVDPTSVAPADDVVARSLAATALAGTFGALKAGKTMEAARANGFVRASMSAGRMVMNGGRDAVLAATQADARAVGYVRVADAEPCAFCESLVGQRSAPDAFPAHDGCGCTAEPVFH